MVENLTEALRFVGFGLTQIQRIQPSNISVRFVQSVFVFPATNYFQWMVVRKRRYATAARMATMV